MMKYRLISIWLVVFWFLIHGSQISIKAAYGINRTINFQGKLVDDAGVNVPNSTPVTATFSIYETNDTCPGGGTAVWSENQTFTPVDGIFQVALGSVTPFGSSIDFSQDTLYLGIQISGETNEMCSGSSRIRLASVPQAFNAERFAGLTADNNQTNYFTITGGQGTPATLKVNGDITVGSIISPTGAGGLTLESNGDNGLVFNSSGTSVSAIDINALGTVAGAAITLDTTDGGISLVAAGASNGDITLSPTDDFTLNGTAGSLINVGTSAVTQTITLGALTNTDLILQDANWGITGVGVASFITGSTLGTTTFTTNNIADSGALTIKSATSNALTLDTGTTGTINLGTGSSGKTINIGTDNTNADTINIGSALDNVSITGNLWSVNASGILTVQQCIGCGTNPQTVRRLGANFTKTVDTSFSTITDGDDDDDQDLTFLTGTDETWVFEAVIYVNSPAAADMKYQVTGPTNVTCSLGFENSEDTVNVSNVACGASSGQLNSDGAYNVVRVSGTVVTDSSNSGRVSVQFGQNAGSGTSTILAGSYIIAEKVNDGTGGETISLTGDITGSGSTTIDTTIGADKVVSSMILDGTIVGGDLATNIAISTTGNITTSGSGAITSAGAIVAPTSTNTINNLVISAATQTISANSIADSGALTLTSGINYLLTLKSANNPSGSSGGVVVISGDAGNGTAGDVSIDAGVSSLGNGAVLIGTAARVQDITLGNTTGGVITLGQTSGSDLVLQDANWGISGAGVGSLFSMTATTGNVAITSGDLTLGGVTRISNAGVGTFVTGTAVGSQTFTTNNIADSGALTVSSAADYDLTLKSASNGTATGAVNIITGNSSAGTAGNILLDVGTSVSGNGSILIGTAARTQDITVGNASGGTITIGGASGSDLVLQDANWGVTGAGAGTFLSMVATTGNVAITSGDLTLGGTTRVSNTGIGTFVSGTVLGSMTFTTNNIADSGALTIKSGDGAYALTLDSGTTGAINLGTGTSGKTINIGTDNSNKDTINIGSGLDDVSITGNNWSISSSGVLTVQSCIGCGDGGGGDSGTHYYSVRLSGDYTNDTITFTDVVDDATGTSSLSFPIGANETWIVEITASYTSPAAADMQLQMTCPTGADGVFAFYEVEQGAQVVGNVGCDTSTGNVTATGTDDAIDVRGTVVNGDTAGVVQLQFRQNTASGTSTIYTGSYLVAYPESDGGTITLTGDVVGTGTTSIVTSIGAGKVTSTMILDNTISGSDLATDIGISTSGNLVTTGGGTITSAGAFSGPTSTNTINGLVINNSTLSLTNGSITGTAGVAITSALGANALTLDSGSVGNVNLGTGNNAKTINFGTGNAGNTVNIGTDNTTKDTVNIGSALDDVVITAANWSITAAGVLTVQSCVGCSAGASQTPWLSDIDAENFSLLDLGSNITSRSSLVLGSANNGAGASGGLTINTGAGTTSTGGLTLVTGNSSTGAAGDISMDVGTSSLGNGSILIGTAAKSQNVTVGNTTGGTITIGGTSGSNLILQDADWGVTGAGVGTMYSLTATTGNIAITSGDLTVGGTTRINNSGVGTLITGSTIGSLTFTTNNIADSGGLTIKSATGANDITLDSGSTGNVNIGTGANAKTISIGTAAVANTITIGTSSATDVSISDNNWSITADGTASFGAISAATNTSISASNYGVDFADSDSNPSCAAGDYKVYADTSDGRLKKCQNGSISDLAQDEQVKNRAKSADQSVTSSTTLTDETALQFPIGATEEWNVIWNLVVSNNNDAGSDWKAAVVGPAGNTCNVLQSGAEPAGAAFPQVTTTDCIEAPGELVNNAILASSVPFIVNITANIAGGGTAGTVKVQFAQNTSDTTPTTVKEGSVMNAYLVTGADLAEYYYTLDTSLEPGDVVALDSMLPDGVKKTATQYDRQTMGVISTKPGLVMGGSSGGNGGYPALVALSGRVPVKVSTENGPIKPGDMLTASSVPGVAMRMTKSGQSIGMAITGYESEGLGMVTVFVKTGFAGGAKVIELAVNNASQTDVTRAVLEYAIAESAKLTEDQLGEIFTDRIVAGLEIITPRLVADKVEAREISVENITADWIKAKRIEGLDILAGKYSKLEEGMASLSAGLTITPSPWPTPTEIPGQVYDLAWLESLLDGKTLTFSGPVTFAQRATFRQAPEWGSDSGGLAEIKEKSDRVEIVFDNEYISLPVVLVNISNPDTISLESNKKLWNDSVRYTVVNKTKKGFMIVLSETAKEDIQFSWTAMAVKEPKTFTSKLLELTPTPIPIILPIPTQEAASDSGQNRAVDLGG